jgi:hypothetical protein
MKRLISILAIVFASSTAHAQPTAAEAGKLVAARRSYAEGVKAADHGQWSIAHDRFQTSYELAPRAHTLFNLAGAQSQTGRLVEATESYRRFLREPGIENDLREQATVQLELVEKQLAQLVLDIIDLEPGDAISIDGVELPRTALRVAIPMNPGLHVARIQRGTSVVATRTVSLASGAAELVRIELPPRPILELPRTIPERRDALDGTARLPPGPPPPPPRTSRSWLRSPWLWSSVAVVVAGGAVGGYLIRRPDGVWIR